MSVIRSLAFGDLAAGWWGAAWVPDDDLPARLAWGQGEAVGVVEAALQPAGQTEPWRVEGEQVSLRVSPAGPMARASAEGSDLASLDQLCTVSGKLMVGADERELSSVGWRASVEGTVDLNGIDSFRQTSAWFESAEGLSLIALRPRRSRGHDADLVLATVLEPEPGPPVADPRLSTTYDAGGLPASAGLELWFDEEQESDPEENGERFPRRAAGEVTGDGVAWEVAGFKLHAAPLRWHSRGSEGAGVYLLGHRE